MFIHLRIAGCMCLTHTVSGGQVDRGAFFSKWSLQFELVCSEHEKQLKAEPVKWQKNS